MKKYEVCQKIAKKLKIDIETVNELAYSGIIDITNPLHFKVAPLLIENGISLSTGKTKKKGSKGSVTKEEYIDNLDVDNKMFAYRIKSRMKKPESVDGFIVGKKSTDGNGNSITKFYLITESEL